MGSLTFLNYTNRVLQDLNETTVTALSSTRGVQTVAKNSVNRAINDVSNSEVEWPFTVAAGTITTVAGQAEYTKPANSKTIDFDSFTVQESASTAEKVLKFISFNEYLERLNESDTNPNASAQALPQYVYFTPDENIGLSPVPDASTYTARYYYYATHTDMTAAADVPVIPERFHDVIVNRARYYTHMLRSDTQFSQLALRDYDAGLNRMRVELINRKDYMRAV